MIQVINSQVQNSKTSKFALSSFCFGGYILASGKIFGYWRLFGVRYVLELFGVICRHLRKVIVIETHIKESY